LRALHRLKIKNAQRQWCGGAKKKIGFETGSIELFKARREALVSRDCST
jgi:hypothetical protein